MSDRKLPSSPKSIRQRRSLVRKATYSAIVVSLCFLLFEVALAAVGVKPLNTAVDPFVGFASNSTLFERTGAGTYQTVQPKLRWFNQQSFTVEKSARERRVFVVGGSTVFGRPYSHTTSFAGFLQDFLNAGSESQDWTVVNCGGVSYASYRLASIVEEIVKYEPDYVVIYTGHNEFLEQRTYGHLKDASGNLKLARGLTGRLRTATLFHNVVSSEKSAKVSRRSVLPNDVNAILETTVGPSSYHHDTFDRAAVVAHFRFNLERMISLIRSAGAIPVVVVPASNRSSFSPFKSEYRQPRNADQIRRFDNLREQAIANLELDPDQATQIASELAAAAPEFADYQFLLGQALSADGRHADAERAYQAAVDADVCPLRATSEIVAAVRSAANFADVELIDFPMLISSSSRSGAGTREEDWFYDHVHPTIDGHDRLARELLAQIAHVDPSVNVDKSTLAAVSAQVRDRVSAREHSVALKNLSKVLGWAGKVEIAADLARRAETTLTDDAEAIYLAGSAFYRDGDYEQASKKFAAAIAADADYALGYYGMGLIESNRGNDVAAKVSFREALDRDPTSAQIAYSLALAEARTGNIAAAEKYYKQAIERQPLLAEAHHNLGILYATSSRPHRACEHLATACRIQPENVDMSFSFAQALEMAGETESAIRRYRGIVTRFPDYRFAIDAEERLRALEAD